MSAAYGSAEWLQERAQYIGASEMPMVCGESPYGGPLTLVRRKLGLDVVEQTHAMRRGHIYEPAILAEFAELHPEYTLGYAGTTPHPNGDWLRATPDSLARRGADTVVIEAKMVHPSQRDKYGETGSDDLPYDKQIQTQVQMDVFGCSLAIVVVNFGFETREYYIEANTETQGLLFDAGHDLWHNHVVPKVLPEPDLASDTYEAISRSLRQRGKSLVEASEPLATLVREFGDVKSALKTLGEREDELKKELALAVSADYGIDAGSNGRVLWPESAGRSSLDTEGLLRELNVPDDVVQRYTRVGHPYRTMRYYPPKKGG